MLFSNDASLQNSQSCNCDNHYAVDVTVAIKFSRDGHTNEMAVIQRSKTFVWFRILIKNVQINENISL